MSKVCGYCEAEREFRAEDRVETYDVRGLAVELPVTVEVCAECGQDRYDETRDDDLVARAYAMCRAEKGLLCPDEIVAIRKRYRLSQKSLATLLGMSEATINRYENGGLQDAAHDNAIRFAASPESMLYLLERRSDVLSEWQRDRALESVKAALAARARAVISMMPKGATAETGLREFDYDRYAAVVVWFCAALGSVCRTKLNKLLFYADFLAFNHRGRSITGAAYRRVQYGPVPAQYGGLEDALEADDWITVEEGEFENGNTYNGLTSGPAADRGGADLDADELRVLEFVVEQLRDLTSKALSARSHQEDAYTQTADKEIISYEHAATLSLTLPKA